jgi:hypothetical protein
MREHPHILYWIRICYGHVLHTVGLISKNTLVSCIGYVSVMDTCSHDKYPWTIGKNKYMNIRYLGLDISAVGYGPAQSTDWYLKAIATRSGHSLPWTPQQHTWAHTAPPPCHSTPAVVTPGGQQQ